MNCHDIEPLLFAEGDGGLTAEQCASLAQHVAACPACTRLRAQFAAALTTYREDAAKVPVPDVEVEWRKLRAELSGGRSGAVGKRPLAPVIWFGTALAAAAAVALAYFGRSPTPTATAAAPALVEAGDAGASTMVYVDQESGWLVVWATDGGTKTSG